MDENNTKPQKDIFLPGSILVAGVMISASIIYLVGNKNVSPTVVNPNVGGQQNEDIKILDREVVLGDSNAPVSFIEYGDYQCPFCARFFRDVEGKLRDEYIKTGKVKMVFRNFQFLGPESVAAAEAAECAKDQNKFWEFHDAIYEEELIDGREHNGNLNRDFFVKTASGLKLNLGDFSSCIDSRKYADKIEQDKAEASAAGANSTPTTFVNGEKIQGAVPYEQFKAVIERKLKNG